MKKRRDRAMVGERKVYLTPVGYKRLEEELKNLKEVKKKEVAERVAEARSLGDLSENSEYHAARDELRRIEDRIEHLEKLLENAEVIDYSRIDTDRVVVGVTVELQELTGRKRRKVYTIVDCDEEVDLDGGWISKDSPLGRALLGRGVGETVEFVSPSGRLKKYKILNITIPGR